MSGKMEKARSEFMSKKRQWLRMLTDFGTRGWYVDTSNWGTVLRKNYKNKIANKDFMVTMYFYGVTAVRKNKDDFISLTEYKQNREKYDNEEYLEKDLEVILITDMGLTITDTATMLLDTDDLEDIIKEYRAFNKINLYIAL